MTTVPEHLRIDAELQIDHIRHAGDTGAAAVVRCVRGPVRLRARFHRIRGTSAPIDLELTEILFYGHPVGELDLSHTALVTLWGEGVPLLAAAGDAEHRWQVVQGVNT
ncbi:hypothetical protein ACFV7Q_22910 [Streptomyces sp. NPDC059851]|uniref:hypothetical protein n=1 Tax=Streptomyces sp. NPDC059851 TaxID=3346971 RepID=UPI003667C9D8